MPRTCWGIWGRFLPKDWRVVGEDGSVSYPLRDAGYKMNDLIGRSGLEKA